MRVLTLNLWSYNNPHDYTMRRNITRGAVPGSRAALEPAPSASSWFIRRELIARLLREARPDACALQEVSTDNRIEAGQPSAIWLAANLGWHAIYEEGRLRRVGGVDGGLAILSPHALHQIDSFEIPEQDGGERRLCLVGEVPAPQGRMILLTTHLALASASTGRDAQEESVRRILSFCRGLPRDVPIALAGDLNAGPEDRPIRCLVGLDSVGGETGSFKDAGREATGEWLKTMPSHDPQYALDYILVRGAAVDSCWTVGGQSRGGYLPSDHLGLVADLHW